MAFRIRWNSVRFIAWLEGAQAHDRERAVVFSRSGQTSALFSQFLPRKKLPVLPSLVIHGCAHGHHFLES